jgi:hypothetical protein
MQRPSVKNKNLPRGAVNIASTSGIEGPGSNPARVCGFYGKQKYTNAVVYN